MPCGSCGKRRRSFKNKLAKAAKQPLPLLTKEIKTRAEKIEARKQKIESRRKRMAARNARIVMRNNAIRRANNENNT